MDMEIVYNGTLERLYVLSQQRQAPASPNSYVPVAAAKVAPLVREVMLQYEWLTPSQIARLSGVCYSAVNARLRRLLLEGKVEKRQRKVPVRREHDGSMGVALLNEYRLRTGR